MKTDRELMQQAVDALEKAMGDSAEFGRISYGECLSAINALRERLAQLPQTPRQWQGLTEKRIEELYSFWIVDCQDIVGFARAIERTFKEKNDGQ